MLAFKPSDKQVAYCRYISDCDPHGDGNAYFVLLQGAQGSGKTSIGVRGWASWLAADCPPSSTAHLHLRFGRSGPCRDRWDAPGVVDRNRPAS